jgi:hypothetical protein
MRTLYTTTTVEEADIQLHVIEDNPRGAMIRVTLNGKLWCDILYTRGSDSMQLASAFEFEMMVVWQQLHEEDVYRKIKRFMRLRDEKKTGTPVSES